MVVDDEPFNLNAMKILLNLSSQKLGFDVRIINQLTDFMCGGVEALEKQIEAIENGNIYALILTDISMPCLDGFEMSEQIRRFCYERQIP